MARYLLVLTDLYKVYPKVSASNSNNHSHLRRMSGKVYTFGNMTSQRALRSDIVHAINCKMCIGTAYAIGMVPKQTEASTMWVVEMNDRETCNRVVQDYATFETYKEASAFRDAHEGSFRKCGWYGVVVYKPWLN